MIFKILLNYITGFVNITVEGFFIERFINNCIKNKIFLWSIKRNNSSILTANISINQFKRLHKISNKTKYRIKLNSKHGLPIIIHKYRKRKVFIIAIMPILLGIIILSKFIWNIEIMGTGDINKDEIIEQLGEEGIKIGKLKSKIDTKLVISNIRLKRSDISWMSIDMKGTNIIVNIVKAEEKPNIVDEISNCNIVANKKALITKVTADTGTALVNVGDIVEEKTVLIAGIMEGKYTGTRNVHAKGTVLGKVWYTKTIESRID